MPYNCELCDTGEQAALLITPLNGAPSMAVGNACAATALTTLLAGYLDVPADDLAKLIDTLMLGEDQTPEQLNLPTGYVYGPDGQTILSESDVDAGLCGLIHDDWQHCHRPAGHSGKHNKQPPGGKEAAQGPPADAEATAGPGGER